MGLLLGNRPGSETADPSSSPCGRNRRTCGLPVEEVAVPVDCLSVRAWIANTFSQSAAREIRKMRTFSDCEPCGQPPPASQRDPCMGGSWRGRLTGKRLVSVRRSDARAATAARSRPKESCRSPACTDARGRSQLECPDGPCPDAPRIFDGITAIKSPCRVSNQGRHPRADSSLRQPGARSSLELHARTRGSRGLL